MTPGHVFVVRGDITKLVCDHVLDNGLRGQQLGCSRSSSID